MHNENNKQEIKWIRCKKCGHKLLKVVDVKENSKTIEIKCSSCKTISVVEIK